jgi:O-antigen/teichoic acid export membrane protein
VLGATLFVYCVTGFAGFLVIEAGAPWIVGAFKIKPESLPVAITSLRIAGISFFLTTIYGALEKIPAATQRYDVSSKLQMCMVLLRYGAMIVVVRQGAGIIGLTGVLAGSSVIYIVVYATIARRLISGVRCWPHVHKKGLKEVFGFGVFSFVNQIIGTISTSTDQFVLGMFFGAKDVGYLTAPRDLLMRVQGMTGAAGYALFPRFSAMDEGAEMERLYRFSLWVLTSFAMLLFIPAAIVLPVFLSLWISPEFSEHSSSVARLLALGMAFNGGVGAYFALLKGTGRVRWITSIVTTLTVLSILVAAGLVYKFGMIGSGIRMLVFSWCGITICLVVGRKVFPRFALGRAIAECAILPVLTGLALFFAGQYTLRILTIKTWVGMILVAAASAALLALISVAANYACFGKEGSAFAFASRLKSNPKAAHLARKLGFTI